MTIHTGQTVHGVTAVRDGVRYSLYLCETTLPDPEPPSAATVDLGYLESAVEAQLGFFARAMPVLHCMSDAKLAEAVEGYRKLLAAGSAQPLHRIRPSTVAISVELVRRAHMLHPLAYLESRAKASADSSGVGVPSTIWAGIDLESAVREVRCGWRREDAAVRAPF